MALMYQEVTLDTDTPDRDGLCVFREGRLLAVLSHLSDMHAEVQGHWYVEALFGEAPMLQPPTFVDLPAFEDWLITLP